MQQMHLHQLTPPGAKSSSSHIRAYPPTLEASRLRGSELQLGPQDNQPEGAPAPSDQKLSRVTHSTAQTLPNHLQKHHQARFTGICLGTNRPVGQDESCSRLAASQAHNLFFVTINQPQTAVRCRVLCGSFWTFLWILPNLPGLVIRCRLTVEINQGPADLSSPLGPPQALCKPLSRPVNASVAPLGNVVLSRFSTSAQLCLHSCFVPEPLS
jgi:hypothetical protein